MSDEGALPNLSFTYEVTSSCGCGSVHLSDGVNETFLETTCWLGNPIPNLVRALEDLLNYSSEARCSWKCEQSGGYHLIFSRVGDALSLRILYFRDFPFPNNKYRDVGGITDFSTTCDLWKFAAKLRLYESRIGTSREEGQPKKQKHQQLASLIPGRKSLEELLEEHKRQIKAGDQKTKGTARH